MKMQRVFVLLSLLTIFLLVVACGGAAPQPAAEQPAEEPAAEEAGQAAEPFKMGLLVPGSANDEGWNQIAYDALLRIEDELGAEISYVELEQNPASFEKAFRDYLEEFLDCPVSWGNAVEKFYFSKEEFEEALPGVYYYWRVLSKRPEGWIVSGTGRLESPVCPVDRVPE